MHLLGDRRAADERATLEDDDFLAAARKVGRGNQTVVSAADDNRIVAIRVHRVITRSNEAPPSRRPSNVAPTHTTTLASAYASARPDWPAMINWTVSALNAENVVKPPQTPATRNVWSWGDHWRET